MDGRLDIDAPTWRRVSPLLDAALDLPPQVRLGWLEALPAQHADLKGTLRELLARAARIETGALLDTLPKLDTGDATAAAALHGRMRRVTRSARTDWCESWVWAAWARCGSPIAPTG